MNRIGSSYGNFNVQKSDKIKGKDVKAETAGVSSKKGSVGDKVTLSENARMQNQNNEVQFLKKKLEFVKSPEESAHKARIEELKSQVQDGTYSVSFDKLADKLLDSGIFGSGV